MGLLWRGLFLFSAAIVAKSPHAHNTIPICNIRLFDSWSVMLSEGVGVSVGVGIGVAR